MTDSRASILLPLILILAAGGSQVMLAPSFDQMLFGLNNDSTMRMVSLRDLMAGQAWRDLYQYRLGLEGGFEMHWSRIVDALMLLMLNVFDLFSGPERAEYWLLVMWPLVWFAVALMCLWRLVDYLAGPMAAFFAALIGTSILIGQLVFRPGSVDHHNIQIALFLLTLVGLVARHRAIVWPFFSGAAMAVSLSIGVETMPHFALLAVAVGLTWLANAGREAAATRAFGIGILVGLVVYFVGFAPASARAGGYCDAMSVDLAMPMSVGALGLVLLSVLPRSVGRAGQVAALAAVGIGAGGIAILLYPACLSNPLDHLDPYLHELWLGFVFEAQGVGSVLAGGTEPIFGLYYLFGAFAVLVSLWLTATRQATRTEWLLISVLLMAALAFSLYQIRGVVLLVALAVLPVSVLAAHLRERWQQTGRAVYGLGVMALVLLSVPSVWSAGISAAQRLSGAEVTMAETGGGTEHTNCFTPGQMAKFASMERGVVAANSNLGAQILLHTPHRTLSAPYHRNQLGMIAELEILMAPNDAEAASLLKQHQIDYFVVCSMDPELTTLHSAGHSGFGYAVLQGDLPEFLVPVSGDETQPLKIFRVEMPTSS